MEVSDLAGEVGLAGHLVPGNVLGDVPGQVDDGSQSRD